MFKWYQQAGICYAYLADIEWFEHSYDMYDCYQTLRDARWFRRGWTLQELLAPAHIKFFAKNWKPLGTKLQLCDIIAKITGVSHNALLGQPLSDFNVAERMSWAAARETTRPEDVAYSLLGIFDVHMPLLYGEGGRAFQRLQEHILERSEDYTIFTWQAPGSAKDLSLIASAPIDFAETGTETFDKEWQYSQLSSSFETRTGLREDTESFETKMREPPVATSRGIRMQLYTIELFNGSYKALVCPIRTNPLERGFWLCLEVWRPHVSSDVVYRRGNSWTVEHISSLETAQLRQIYGARTNYVENVASRQDHNAAFLGRIVNELILGDRPSQPAPALARRLRNHNLWCPRCSSYAPRFGTRQFRGTLCGRCDREKLQLAIKDLEKDATTKTFEDAQELTVLKRVSSLTDGFEKDEATDRQLLKLESAVRNIYTRPSNMPIAGRQSIPSMGLLLCSLIAISRERGEGRVLDSRQALLLKDFVRIVESSPSIGSFAFHICSEHMAFISTAGQDLLRIMLQCCAVLAEDDPRDMLSVKVAGSQYADFARRQTANSDNPRILHWPNIDAGTSLLSASDHHHIIDLFGKTLMNRPTVAKHDSFIRWMAKAVDLWSSHAEAHHLCAVFVHIRQAIWQNGIMGGRRNPFVVDARIIEALLSYHFSHTDDTTFPGTHQWKIREIHTMAAGNAPWQRVLQRILPDGNEDATTQSSDSKIYILD